MNEGFFASSVVKTPIKYKELPPVLKMKFDATEAKRAKVIDYVSPKVPQLIMDIECYVNYFLIKFMRVEDGEFIEYEMTDECSLAIDSIKALIKTHEIITFNGNKFDIPILRLALAGASNAQLKKACDDLIKNELSVWKFEEKHKLEPFKMRHIDIIELTVGMVSLKIYGGRLHCKKMQDLPYPEDATLRDFEMDEIAEYCGNDLSVTKLIFMHLLQQIEMRRVMSKRYKIDLLSKSDAQIAEAVIKSEIEAIKGTELKRQTISKGEFHYKVPSFIKFNTDVLLDALDIVTTSPFIVDKTGRPQMPKELTQLKVELGSSVYKMGMGGLHSTEKAAYHVADENYTLHDWDVASYYPAIILNCKLFPKQLGKDFLTVYQSIVTERLEAKRSGDKAKADSLKICVNGSFGKLGSPYSTLYAPDLMVQVTVTGQLSLLMLIEMLEGRGIPVVSGNTDGIVIKCPAGKDAMMRMIIKRWETITGFEMEETQYAGIYSRDVNNYLAIKTNGEVKTKGIFASAGISKNPENEICSIAMIEYLKHGTTFEHTIRSCRDITKFITVRSVTGGAVKDGVYLGKAVRFYHATGVKGAIKYKTNDKDVALSEGARPIMNLDGSFPKDVDYEWYIHKTKEMF